MESLIALEEVRNCSKAQVVFPDSAPKVSISGAESEFVVLVLLDGLQVRARHKISVSNVSDIGTYCIVPFSVERVGMNIDLCDLLF
jgi:hypothetical protein